MCAGLLIMHFKFEPFRCALSTLPCSLTWAIALVAVRPRGHPRVLHPVVFRAGSVGSSVSWSRRASEQCLVVLSIWRQKVASQTRFTTEASREGGGLLTYPWQRKRSSSPAPACRFWIPAAVRFSLCCRHVCLISFIMKF